MLLPEQRRPPCTRHRERYESTALLPVAVSVNEAIGRYLLHVRRLDDGRVEAVYASG